MRDRLLANSNCGYWPTNLRAMRTQLGEQRSWVSDSVVDVGYS